MCKQNGWTAWRRHLGLWVVFLAMLFGAVACSPGTPTRLPPSPTLPPVGQPTGPAVATGTEMAKATLPPLPTAGPSLAPITSTLAPTAAVTATVARATRPPATAVPATPKPAALAGRIAYTVVSDPTPRLHTIWVAKVDGSGAGKILDYGGWPALSPDGKRIAFYQLPGGGKNEGLYIADAFGGNPVPVYISPGVCCINWSRDGTWLIFANSNRPNRPGGPILMVKVDGAFKTIVDLKVIGSGPTFSPDGKQVAFSGCEPNTGTCGMRIVTADGTGQSRTVTRDNGGNAQWSPRGDKIVYQADDGAGHNQVFVVNVDGSGKKQLTTGKGNDGQPIWSRDGGSIFWRSDQDGTSWAIYVMNADGSNRRKILSDVPPDSNLWGWEALSVGP